ncbi:hypothetical protein HDV05_001594 [Chytridiales sp. JEL 0842]|nr:hypothetical protein HDV05_001594 [Chytridiales sp. JEL 0842]
MDRPPPPSHSAFSSARRISSVNRDGSYTSTGAGFADPQRPPQQRAYMPSSSSEAEDYNRYDRNRGASVSSMDADGDGGYRVASIDALTDSDRDSRRRERKNKSKSSRDQVTAVVPRNKDNEVVPITAGSRSISNNKEDDEASSTVSDLSLGSSSSIDAGESKLQLDHEAEVPTRVITYTALTHGSEDDNNGRIVDIDDSRDDLAVDSSTDALASSAKPPKNLRKKQSAATVDGSEYQLASQDNNSSEPSTRKLRRNNLPSASSSDSLPSSSNSHPPTFSADSLSTIHKPLPRRPLTPLSSTDTLSRNSYQSMDNLNQQRSLRPPPPPRAPSPSRSPPRRTRELGQEIESGGLSGRRTPPSYLGSSNDEIYFSRSGGLDKVGGRRTPSSRNMKSRDVSVDSEDDSNSTKKPKLKIDTSMGGGGSSRPSSPKRRKQSPTPPTFDQYQSHITLDLPRPESPTKTKKGTFKKIKIFSPTTNDVVILRSSDLAPPSTSPKLQTKRLQRTYSNLYSLAGTEDPHSHDPLGFVSGDDSVNVLRVEEMMDDEEAEKREEEERLRGILASSAPTKYVADAEGNGGGGDKKGSGKMEGGGGVGGAGKKGAGGSGVVRGVARAAEGGEGPVVMDGGEPEVLFVDDGGRFRQILRSRAAAGDVDLESNSHEDFDRELRLVCVQIETNATYLLQTLHGLYAGICLLSLLLFPFIDPFDPSSTTPTSTTPTPIPRFNNVWDQNGLQYPLTQTTIGMMTAVFVQFFSTVSTPVGRLFSFVGTGAVLATIDGGGMMKGGLHGGAPRVNGDSDENRFKKGRHHPVSSNTPSLHALLKWWRRRSGRVRRIAGVLGVLFTLTSYIFSILMTRTEDRLYESQMTPYGGFYGSPGWCFDFGLLKSHPFLKADLEEWRIYNAVRGFLGVAGWITSCWARRLADGSTRWKSKRKGGRDGGEEGGWGGFWGYVFGGWLSTSRGTERGRDGTGDGVGVGGGEMGKGGRGRGGPGGAGKRAGASAFKGGRLKGVIGSARNSSTTRRSVVMASVPDVRGTLDWLKS